MGLFANLFGKKKPESAKLPEQSVIVHFQYGKTDLDDLYALEDRLEPLIADAGVGEFDGHEIALDGSDGFLYMYGPDADKLFDVVKPELEATSFTRGASVKLCYHNPGEQGPEKEVTIK